MFRMGKGSDRDLSQTLLMKGKRYFFNLLLSEILNFVSKLTKFSDFKNMFLVRSANSSELSALLSVMLEFCSMPDANSWVDSEMSEIWWAMFVMSPTIVCKLSSEVLEMDTPFSTSLILSLIKSLMSLADAAERSANLRTSSATTAKPFPCSPARAASIAAFNANKFV